jgi:catechol 2,3-dioxygenase-like lactoylglutathione lyase family enzyme
MFVPGEPATPVQVIDVRDLAAFLVAAIERKATGAFNLTGPDRPITVLDLARACIEGTGSRSTPVLVSSQTLQDAGVPRGWDQTPFWIWPELHPLMQVSIDRALAAGLTFRPLLDTVRDTHAWLRTTVLDVPVAPRERVTPRIVGIDHADVRVASLAAVETFYDTLLPALGLSRKTEAHVGRDGEWYDVDATRPRNAIEYHVPAGVEPHWFVGFIEDVHTQSNRTRVAFTLDDRDKLGAIERLVRDAGARVIEYANEPDYPALFFEDPIGTRLEIVARRIRD